MLCKIRSLTLVSQGRKVASQEGGVADRGNAEDERGYWRCGASSTAELSVRSGAALWKTITMTIFSAV